MVFLALQALREQMDLMDLMDFRERMGLLELLVPRDLRDLQDQPVVGLDRAPQAQQDLLEQTVPMERME